MIENVIVQSKCGKMAKKGLRVAIVLTSIFGIVFIINILLLTFDNLGNVGNLGGVETDAAAARQATTIEFPPPPLILLLIIDIVLFVFSRSKAEITVTDKRVYGVFGFSGKRMDLPLDSISSIRTAAWGGIAIATSSGFIKYRMLDEKNKVYTAVSNLLNERQQSKENVSNILPIPSNADELQKYKNLLDNGAITQEEFDLKKKQLLGL